MRELLKNLRHPKMERFPDVITSQIKSLILSNDIKVGEKLPSERELGELLKVSRVVVRESLRSLEQTGLIEIKLGSAGGAFVIDKIHKPLSNSISDLFVEGKLTINHFVEARQAIEQLSISLALKNLNDKDIQRFQNINQKLINEIEDRGKIGENNMAFHVAIAEISGNPLIKMIVQSLIELLNTRVVDLRPKKWRTRAFIEDVHRRHNEIIEAMRERNVDLCKKLMREDTEFTKLVGT